MVIKKTSPFHIIKDPVHGTMQFTEEENNWIKPFIDSALFQRLRHIKQLGMGDFIFPGAVHTRFNHAIGCCYVASQIANKLQLPNKERKTVMLACLLHDIGHGPFSHAFEGVFQNKCIQHEAWTPLFLDDYLKTNLTKIANKEEFSTIKNLIMHQEKNKKLLADIVSSQLDADRLDYLRRDSHFCGVTYGEYDFQWLLHCLAIVPDEKNYQRLGINYKGIGVVEQYLMARRLMIRNVYLHGKKYAAEALLSSFLRHLAHDLGDEGSFQEIREKNLSRFLIAVHAFNQKIKAEPKNKNALIKAFLKKQYPLYKKLCDYDIFSMLRYFANLNKKHPTIEIAKRLHTRCFPKVFYIDEKHLEKTREFIQEMKVEKNIDSWQIHLIHLPNQSYQGSQDPILVIDKMKKINSLHENSLVISGLSDKYENAHLLFIDRGILTNKKIKHFCEHSGAL